MKTYTIEYYYDFNPEEIKICNFTTDEELKDDILTSEQIHSIYVTLQGKLGVILNDDSSKLAYRHRIGNPYRVHYKILKQVDVKFDENEYLSNDLIIYLNLIELGCTLVEKNPTTEEVQMYNALINSYDINLICDYFISKIKLEFYQHILIKEPLEYLYNIISAIPKTLTYNNIKRYDKLDFNLEYLNKEHKNKIEVYETIIEVLKRLSRVISEITTLFRFHYDYSPYVTLNYYFSRVQELIHTEIAQFPERNSYSNVELDNELIRQRNILSELTDYNNINRLSNILYNLDLLYNFKELKKLDRCCIALLLANFCPLFKKQAIKPFKKFKKLICEYYGTPDVSFKENDCVRRAEELLNQHRGFWRYDTKKNPRQQHYERQ